MLDLDIHIIYGEVLQQITALKIHSMDAKEHQMEIII
jgi:hypothetical protein